MSKSILKCDPGPYLGQYHGLTVMRPLIFSFIALPEKGGRLEIVNRE